ncbi:hypothetical protein Droror1_Dr00004343 [Drosera rotundifolia]
MPFSLKTMRSMDLSCTTPASTAIASSNMEPPDTPRRSLSHRLNKIFSYREQQRTPRVSESPLFTPRAASFSVYSGRKSSAERSLFALPFTPRAAFFGREKSRKSSVEDSGHNSRVEQYSSRKSSAELYSRTSSAEKYSSKSRASMIAAMMMRRKSSSDMYELVSPPNSPRHLLKDMPDSRDSIVMVPGKPPAGPGDKMIRRDDCLRTSSFSDAPHRKSMGWFPSHLATPSLSRSSTGRSKPPIDPRPPALASPASAQSRNQVVVLRVSLHCRGCEAKLRKHLSKMEGVTSFSIDLATKKVTIVGNITPLGVLTSISKVKNAQLWPSSPSSVPSFSSSSISSSSSASTVESSY